MNGKFLELEEAKEYLKGLGLINSSDWIRYCKNKLRPNNIPSNPNIFYKNSGWISWEDFLGDSKYYTYEEAKNKCKNIGVVNSEDWSIYINSKNRDIKIPTEPNKHYKNKGWVSWQEFIPTYERKKYVKTKIRTHNFTSYCEARKIVLGLKIKSIFQYQRGEHKNFLKLNNIPSNPDKVYKNEEWVSWSDFLGSEIKTPRNSKGVEFLNYEEAKLVVNKLKLNNVREWEKSIKPINIPYEPHNYYRNKGWVNWQEFLGYEKANHMSINIRNNNFYTYEEAKEAVKNLGIKSASQWDSKYTKDKNFDTRLPKYPKDSYKNKGWISWSDFLSFDIEGYWKKTFHSYEEAKKIVHTYEFISISEWNRNYNQTDIRFDKLPSEPDRTYKNSGWVSWSDFLGVSYVGQIKYNFLPFDEARNYMHKIGLNNLYEWEKFKKDGIKPSFIPSQPERTYKNKFKGYMDFLGYQYNNNQKSLGEISIMDYLTKNDINFEMEKTFDGCINKLPLRFDFYLIDSNILIEYDGKQHYESTEIFGGEENFKLTKINDKIKNQWVLDNNYKLIRIPYYRYKRIHEILDYELSNPNL